MAQQQGGRGSSPRTNNPYTRLADGNNEMAEVGSSTNLISRPADGAQRSMSGFYDEISSVRGSLEQFNQNVSRISELYSVSINTTDEAAAQRNTAELDGLSTDTSALINTLKQRIKTLEGEGTSGSYGYVKKQQTGLVKSKFVEEIERYHTIELQYRQEYKQRLETQYKIVKPDATQEDICAFVDDDNGEHNFSQTFLDADRDGEYQAAYREVQERHKDIRKIERTLHELALLLDDMGNSIEQQDETGDATEWTAVNVEGDVEAGQGNNAHAVSTSKTPRKRWIFGAIFPCLLIAVIITVVVIVTMKS